MTHELKTDLAKMMACIDSCLSCEQTCASCVTHCLRLGGRHATPEHITVLLDCARLCATSADLMMRNSPHHARLCAACAVVCEACADDCERFEGDFVMRRCAEFCRMCAGLCAEMAASTHSQGHAAHA